MEREQMKKIPYASAVGSLMYAQTCTRPDISFAVGMLGRYQSDPGFEHWKAAKKVMRYLQEIKDLRSINRRERDQGFKIYKLKGNLSWLRVLQTVCNLYVYFYFIIIIRNEFEFDDLKYCVLISVLRFTIGIRIYNKL